MGSWSTLPLELLTEILELVYNRHHYSLSQCQLTCKNWSLPSQSLFYSDVKLSTPQQATMFLTSVSTTNTSNSVKKVQLGSELLRSPMIETIFPRLFEFCPNITHLNADEADMAFWTKLLREYYRCNLVHLQSLPEADLNSDEDIKIYGYIASALRTSLTTVYVHDWPQHNPTFKWNEVAQNLNHFTNLETLFVHVGGIQTVLEILSLILGCSKLRELHIKTIEDRKEFYFEDNDTETVEEDLSVYSSTDITNLKIDSITMTSKLIRRILKLFSKLINFELNNIPEVDFGDDPNDDETQNLLYRYQAEGWKIADELWLEFLLHIHNTVPKYYLSKLFFNSVLNVIERFMEAAEVCNDCLELLYVRRKTYCDIKSYVQISSDAFKSTYYGTGFGGTTRGHIQVIYGNSLSEDAATLQHMSLLDRIGGRLRRIRLRIPGSHDFEGVSLNGVDDLIDGCFLSHIFHTCPNLVQLHVDRASIYHCDSHWILNNSIRLLQFSNCNFDPSIFSYISYRLPRLLHLQIGESDFLPTSGHILDNPKNIDLMIPHSKLKLLVWANHSRRYQGATVLHLKVRQETKTQYYALKKSTQKLARSTAINFLASTRNRESLSIDIYCTKIDNLVVCTQDFNIHINIVNKTVSKGTSYLKKNETVIQ